MDDRTEIEHLTETNNETAIQGNETVETRNLVETENVSESSTIPESEKTAIEAAAKRMSEICRMARSNNKFTTDFHKLIVDPGFIKLCGYYEKNNIFSIVGRTQQENWHSSFLAWLLNPNGSHGLGHFPLRCLLAKSCTLVNSHPGIDRKNLPEDSLIETGYFSETVVRPEAIGQSEHPEKSVKYTECITQKSKGVVCEKKYDQYISFDIALSTILTESNAESTFEINKSKTRHRLVLICENKIESPEGKAKKAGDRSKGAGDKNKLQKISQTEMYADFWFGKKAFYPIDADLSACDKNYPALRSKGAKEPYCILLFLSANGVKAKDSRFINIDYSDLYESMLLPALNHPNISDDAKRYLQEYVDLLDLKGYIRSQERQKLLEGIYARHGEVFRQYFSYKLFSMLFVGEGFSKEHFKNNFINEYRANIIHWLYYFSGINKFKIKQKSKEIEAVPSSDFSKDTVDWKSGNKVQAAHGISCWSDDREICSYNLFASAAAEFVENVLKRNHRIFSYIAAMECKYQEILDYLIEMFNPEEIYHPSEDSLVHEKLSLEPIISRLTRTSKIDYTYLAGMLKPSRGEPFPVLYYKDDENHDHGIYINIDKQPSFILKENYHEDSENNWSSGNEICKNMASMFEKPIRGCQWAQFLKTKDGKAVPPPKKQ